MQRSPLRGAFLALATTALLAGACSSGSGSDSATEAVTPDETSTETNSTDTGSTDTVGLDVDLFFEGALSDEVTIEDCTLSGGTETTCYRITAIGYPTSYEVGPFCPTNISDDADAGGIWFDGDAVYDIDGEFITDLPEIYGDDAWQLYDEDGNVYVTDTEEAFDGAAQPNVAEEYQNHCVEGRLEWLDDGEPVAHTVLIPTTPVAADGAASTGNGNTGITLDGIVIAAPAPVDAILGAYTIAAFDDCGGHYNPFEGYHLHGAVGCSENGETADGETPIFAYALDGYAVHSPLDADAIEAAGLDECNGHTTEADGYHYHANDVVENQVLTCFMGQTEASSAADADGGGPPGGGGPPEG